MRFQRTLFLRLTTLKACMLAFAHLLLNMERIFWQKKYELH